MPRPSLRRLLSSRPARIAFGILGGLLLIYLAVDLIFMPLYTRQGSERLVPKLVGLSREQARSVAESVGFEVVEGSPKFGASASEGTIIEQRPMPGATAKPGRKIYIVPAAMQEKGTAPDVTGLELRDALLRGRNNGLITSDTDISYRFSDRVMKGYVISQEPAAGRKMETGSVLKLVVSLGTKPERIYVPYLMEKQLSEVRLQLRDAGLRLGKVVRKETDQYPSGTVIAQSIRSGTEVEGNTAVDVVVAVRVSAPPGGSTESTTPPSPGSKTDE